MNDKIMILAAGNSSRLGENKQLLTIDGDSLLNRTIKCCKMADLGSISIVLGYQSEKMISQLEMEEIEVIINENWRLGMGESIATGARSLDERVTGAYIVLPDQIKLTVAILKSIAVKSTEHPECIITSKYGDNFGAPSYFPSSYFDALRECGGRNGAKKVVEDHLSMVRFIPFEGGEIDVDRPEDLKLVD